MGAAHAETGNGDGNGLKGGEGIDVHDAAHSPCGLVGLDFFTPEQFTFLDVDRLRGMDAVILLNSLSDDQVKRVAVYFEAVEEIGENRYVFNGHELPRMKLRILRGRGFLGNWRPSTKDGRLSATGG